MARRLLLADPLHNMFTESRISHSLYAASTPALPLEAKRRRPAGRALPDRRAAAHEAVSGRLLVEDLQDAVLEESWLPMGLRTLVANELPRLRMTSRELARPNQLRDWLERIERLRGAASEYGPSVGGSRTVATLTRLKASAGDAAAEASRIR